MLLGSCRLHRRHKQNLTYVCYCYLWLKPWAHWSKLPLKRSALPRMQLLIFLISSLKHLIDFISSYILILPPEINSCLLMTPSRKSRDFSHGMDRPLLSPFMGLFVCFCIFLVIDIFLYNFFAHIAQCTHIVTWRPKMTAPILATSYFWMIL